MGKFVVDGYKKQLSFSYTNSGGITNSGTMLFGIGSGDSLPLKYVTNYGSIYVVSPSDASSFLTPYGGFTMSPGASICLMNAAYKMQGYPAEVTGTGGCLALLGLARIEGGNGGIDVRVTVVMSQSSSIILFRGNVNPMTISNFGQGNTLGSYYTVDTISYDPSSGIVTIVNSFHITSVPAPNSQASNAISYSGSAPNGRMACNCDTDFGSYNPFTEYITKVSDAGSTYSADVLITTSANKRWYTTSSIIPAPSIESSTTSTASSPIESSTQSSIVESSTEPSIASSTQSSSFEPSPSETPSEPSPTESSSWPRYIDFSLSLTSILKSLRMLIGMEVIA
ncbi:uncharacterized protein RJT20DRAFT_147582 [Scheffersomyces xylosifermentans]|uniref:uncharacterized protein n=1 Tax=Scheffersomyces xylosifermentans TaxID=1304137 RepID=UPI00315D473D